MIHQHCDATDANEKRQTEADRQALRSQEDDFQQCDENRNGCQHHSRNSGGHALLGPKHTSVIEDENQRPEEGGAHPFSAARCRRALETHPAIKCEAGYEKTNSREKKRRDFVDSYPDR